MSAACDHIPPAGARPARDAHALTATRLLPRFVFGLRLAASVCLALYVTYALELPNPFWAATTAAIVCQPNLGASLQKGRYRLLGTMLGALALVALLAAFPQQRIAFILGLALLCGVCGFGVVLLRGSAAYAAGLCGITAAILFADSMADPSSVVLLAISRVSEIGIGILSTAVVMLLTEPGSARRALAGQMERMATQLHGGFLATLARAGETTEGQTARRSLVKALAPLHLAIDAATGESASVHARRGNLRRSVRCLSEALVGWRNIAHHHPTDGGDAPILRHELAELLAEFDPAASKIYRACGARARAEAIAAIHALKANAAGPTACLLAEGAHKVALCLSEFIDMMLFLRTGEGERKRVPPPPFALADGLPAWIAGVRAVLCVLAVTLFWIATAWPDGAFAVAFAVISTLIFASFADDARTRARDYAAGVAVISVLGGLIYLYVLPGLSTFPALMGLLVLVYVPLGMMQVGSWHPTLFLAMSIAALPLLGIGNPIAYDPAGYFNLALAIFAGSALGTLFFILLPPLAPEQRAWRLIGLSVRDLRRLFRRHDAYDGAQWLTRLTRRLEDMPAQASLEQHALLLTLLATGMAILELRAACVMDEAAPALEAALSALADEHVSQAHTQFQSLSGAAVSGAIHAQAAVLADALTPGGALSAILFPDPRKSSDP